MRSAPSTPAIRARNATYLPALVVVTALALAGCASGGTDSEGLTKQERARRLAVYCGLLDGDYPWLLQAGEGDDPERDLPGTRPVIMDLGLRNWHRYLPPAFQPRGRAVRDSLQEAIDGTLTDLERTEAIEAWGQLLEDLLAAGVCP